MEVDTILASRLARRQINVRPSEAPMHLGAAYEISMRVAAAQHGDIRAWKLGATTKSTRAAFGTDTVYFGPLLDDEVYFDPKSVRIDLAPFRGEAEIALRVGRDVLPDEIDQLSEDLFDSFAPVLECPWSVVANLPDAGLGALLSDRCAAGLLLLSKPTKFDPASVNGRLEIIANGVVLATGAADSGLLMSPGEAALLAIREMLSVGLTVTAGQWISTGGITQCVDLPTTGLIELRYDSRIVLSFQV